MKKNGTLGEGVSLNLRKTVNEKATLYPAKMKNIALVDRNIEKNGRSKGEVSNVVGIESFERASLILAKMRRVTVVDTRTIREVPQAA